VSLAPALTPKVGDLISELVREPSIVQLFEFSAVTWNAHRIHYDRDYARDAEGYPDVLVQSHLHACFLGQALTDAYGARARIVRLGWQNRGMAVPGDRLTVSGTVTKAGFEDRAMRIELTLEERNQREELCVKGWATVVLPEDD
jgi:hydroxyacyl-ACP dehydratase HTD2-like protein with hotdog domain